MTTDTAPLLPAQYRDRNGRLRVDLRAVALLAGPLMVNSAIQAALNLTDTWFVGRISTTAVAAMAAIYWVVLCAILLLGGIGMAVQTFAAQAYGSGRRARAAQAAWSGLYAALLTIPVFGAIGFLGAPLLHLLHVDGEVRELALAYWWPRLVVGGPLGLLVWSLTSFFNGISRTRISLVVTASMALSNIPFNQWFIVNLHMGIAGSAWGTVAAEIVGLSFALTSFLSAPMRRIFRSNVTWRRPLVRRQFVEGLPMGLSTTADLVGLALFQLMLVTASSIAGAATQIVMMLTSIAYMPAIGIALAGTTLVGQSVGMGEIAWAETLGNRIILASAVFMGGIGLLLGVAGHWILPWFVQAGDASAHEVIQLGIPILWLAAAYQAFDGLNIGSSFCLRGASDARVPALLVACLSWLFFVPCAYLMVFAPGQGWLPHVHGFGYGALGGWTVSVAYVVMLGLGLWWRWRSGAWKRPYA
jgi:multidrug resistance protein, MATE family